MFQASLGGGFGAQEYGLQASIRAAVAYDDVCYDYKIEIVFEAQAVIIQSRVPSSVARRAREIIDRTFWIQGGDRRGEVARKKNPAEAGQCARSST